MISESTGELALAGLLHNIGKFMLRAAGGGDRVWDSEGRRDFGYKHAMLTAAFVEEYLPAPWRRAVKSMAGNHHRPRPHSREELMVSLADMLAAAERNDGIEDDNPRQQHPKQLLSIFSVLKAEGIKPSASQRRFLPLRPLSLGWAEAQKQGSHSHGYNDNSRRMTTAGSCLFLGTAHFCGVFAKTAEGHAVAGGLSPPGCAAAADLSERRPTPFGGYGWPRSLEIAVGDTPGGNGLTLPTCKRKAGGRLKWSEDIWICRLCGSQLSKSVRLTEEGRFFPSEK